MTDADRLARELFDLSLIDDVCCLLNEHLLNGVPVLQRFKAELLAERQARAALEQALEQLMKYHLNDSDPWGPTPDGYFKVADVRALLHGAGEKP